MLAGFFAESVPLMIWVTPAETEPFSRDHLKVAPERLTASLPDPP